MKKRLRRTMMFVPGNAPSMIRDAHIYGADSLMFDLEDSVSLGEKDAARVLVYNALKSIDYGQIEKVARINPLSTPYGAKDIEAMVKAGIDVIRLAKTETAEDILEVEALVAEAEKACGRENQVLLMAAIESALGVINAFSISTASKRMMGIALGAEDYCANLQVSRSEEGDELLFARQRIVVAAKAAGIAALDTVFSNINDMESFEKEVRFIKKLGFDGKSVVNPRQIDPVHAIYAPTQREIENALRVKAAILEAEERGSGVISLDGRMVDRPVALRAERVLEVAVACNMLKEEELQ
ncbi:MAG: HpcH/HpaI aldolase/citrate lyase family protein [Oscillospiraceae bacterium]|nr:HpcH/HpaI aldolase/citrate lyase family protein [Oscillospiraceae bacterium]